MALFKIPVIFDSIFAHSLICGIIFLFYFFSSQYKCGVFYKNLPGRVDPNNNFEPLTFIGALPDVLNKPKIQNSQEIRETFGNLKRKQFRIQNVCAKSDGEVVGNARCYAAVSKIN